MYIGLELKMVYFNGYVVLIIHICHSVNMHTYHFRIFTCQDSLALASFFHCAFHQGWMQ